MIHPTRTELLRLKEKRTSVAESAGILRARRQTLIREFLRTVRPFLRSREPIAREYATARAELQLAKGHEGETFVETLAATSGRDVGVDVIECNLMGVRYRELTIWGPFVRAPDERDYAFGTTTPHLEEAIFRFERTTEAVLAMAVYESKLKRLGEEIQRLTRRTRALEERLLPQINQEIKSIDHYLGEREREAHFRLKRFKARRERARSYPPSRS
jgi:V/A-type H+-transporting ATPase subunit D